MVMVRCPQCGAATDDQYGFCIKCGREFPKMAQDEHACPLCGFQNPDEADYCVKCGTPLFFKNQFEENNGIIIKRDISTNHKDYSAPSTTSRLIILLGYIFSILGGLVGLIIAIYLSTRKDPVSKKHGHIQLAIFGFYILLIVIFILTGAITTETLSNYTQLLSGNLTFFQR